MAGDFDPDAYLAKPAGGFDPDAYLAKDAAPPMSSGEHLAAAVTDIPSEIWGAAKSGASKIAETLNPYSERNTSFIEGQKGKSFLGGMGDTIRHGLGIADAPLGALEMVASPLTGTARSVIGHGLSAAPGGGSYEESKNKADIAMMGLGAGRGIRPVPIPSAPPRGPLGVTLSEGQTTGNLSKIQAEQAAIRNTMGDAAYARAKEFYDQQQQQLAEARGGIGQQVARGLPSVENPSEAAATINSEVGGRAALARTATEGAEAQAARDAAAQRGMLADRGRVLDEAVAEGHMPIEAPRETGEIVGHELRSAAQNARQNYRGLYDEAFSRPGQFHAGTFEGIGNRIQGRLTLHDDPVIIDDVTTPIASRAIRDLDNISNLRIQNRADPLGQPNPENIIAVDLRGVDQARKRLVTFYRSARQSNNPSDARAVGRTIDEFDHQVESAMTNGLFSGDEGAVAALQRARAAYSRYSRTFRPQQAGDDVGTAIRRIVDRNATPEEIANMVIGSGRVGNAGLPVRLAERLEQIFGRESDAWSAVRQGIWQRSSQVRNAAGEIDLNKSAASLTDLANSSLGRRVFSQGELDAMRGHAQSIRDMDATIEAMGTTRQAATSRAAYQDAFGGENIGGTQASTFRRIVEGSATPEETAQAVFGAIGSGNPGNVSRLIQSIERIAGANSETMSAIRQGVWQKLTQVAEGTPAPGTAKTAKTINEFVSGRGRTIATQIYSTDELDLMRRYAGIMRQITVPQAGAQWSNNYPLLNATKKIGTMVGTIIGGVIGHKVAPGMFGMGEVAGSMVGAKASKSIEKIGQMSRAKSIAAQMPIVAQTIKEWQLAVARAQKNNTPPSQAALRLAQTNLSRALANLGINQSSLKTLGAGRAQDDQQQVPRPLDQQGGGNSVGEQQQFRHGGRVSHGARLAKDGNYYVPDPRRKGKYLMLVMRHKAA